MKKESAGIYVILTLLAIPVIFFLSACQSENPGVRLTSINADVYAWNQQTIVPWAEDYTGVVTFHGVTEEGKALLGTNFTIEGPDNGVVFDLINDADPYVCENPEPPACNLWYFQAEYTVSKDSTYPKVISVEFVTTGNDVIRPNYKAEPEASLQVMNHFFANGSNEDLTDPNNNPGAMAFTPDLTVIPSLEHPDGLVSMGRYLYVVTEGGGISVLDTATENYQRPSVTDLAIANYGSNDVTIYTGLESGGFDLLYTFATGNGPRDIAHCELNFDGTIDLVTANYLDDTVRIHLGLGDGVFRDPVPPADSTYAVEDGPTAIAVKDFDLNGTTDLAVVNALSNDVTILLNNGNESLQEGWNSPVAVGVSPSDAVAARLNADWLVDLAVTNEGSSTISILQGDGAGGFTLSNVVSTGQGPRSIAKGLFNNDGFIDLATAAGGADTVTVHLGNGNGTFQTAVSYAVGDNPSSVTVGSFNRATDSFLDLAVANEGDDTVQVLLGNGLGAFVPGSPIAVGDAPASVIPGILDQNNFTDLATANSLSGNINILLGNNNGGFPGNGQYTAGTGPSSLVATDFDHQYMDTYLLPEGRNGGYGLLIVDPPDPETDHYLFVTNHSIDGNTFTECGTNTIDGKRMANLVTIYRIDPEAFTPTDARPYNDKLFATVKVGCGPQGIAASTDGSWVYISNAYAGTVSAIDTTALVAYAEAPGYTDPQVPITDAAVVETITGVGPIDSLLDPPPAAYDVLINRGIATTDKAAYVTVSGAYEECNGVPCQGYPGALAVIDIDPESPPSTFHTVIGYITEVENEAIGEYPVGVRHLHRSNRLAVVNGGAPGSCTDPGPLPADTLFGFTYRYANEEHTYTDPIRVTLSDGEVSGAMAMSVDESRGYIARECDRGNTGPDNLGSVVIDMRPGIHDDKRLIGSIGGVKDPDPPYDLIAGGVTSVARKPNTPKIYHARNHGNDTVFGVYGLPEPLDTPEGTNYIWTTNIDGDNSEMKTPATYYQDAHIQINPLYEHPDYENYEHANKAIAVRFQADVDMSSGFCDLNSHTGPTWRTGRDGAVNEGDIFSSEIILINDIMAPPKWVPENYTTLTPDLSVPDDFRHIDTNPVWAPIYYQDTLPNESKEHPIVFMSSRDSTIDPTVFDLDLFILQDASQPEDPIENPAVNLIDLAEVACGPVEPETCGPEYPHNFCDEVEVDGVAAPIQDADPHWVQLPNDVGSDVTTIIFIRETLKIREDITNCLPGVSVGQIWELRYNMLSREVVPNSCRKIYDIDPLVADIVCRNGGTFEDCPNPCYVYDPENTECILGTLFLRFGAYDPKLYEGEVFLDPPNDKDILVFYEKTGEGLDIDLPSGAVALDDLDIYRAPYDFDIWPLDHTDKINISQFADEDLDRAPDDRCDPPCKDADFLPNWCPNQDSDDPSFDPSEVIHLTHNVYYSEDFDDFGDLYAVGIANISDQRRKIFPEEGTLRQAGTMDDDQDFMPNWFPGPNTMTVPQGPGRDPIDLIFSRSRETERTDDLDDNSGGYPFYPPIYPYPLRSYYGLE